MIRARSWGVIAAIAFLAACSHSPPTAPAILTDIELPDGDGDGVPDHVDNCPAAANPGQSDFDADGLGDACDADDDDDGVTDANDVCPQLPGAVNGCPIAVVLDGLLDQVNAPVIADAAPGLSATLAAAQNAIEAGHSGAARGELTAFIKRVEALIRNGRIEPVTGGELIAQALAIIAELSS